MTSQMGNHDTNLSSMFSLFHWCTGSFGMTVKARRNVYKLIHSQTNWFNWLDCDLLWSDAFKHNRIS